MVKARGAMRTRRTMRLSDAYVRLRSRARGELTQQHARACTSYQLYHPPRFRRRPSFRQPHDWRVRSLLAAARGERPQQRHDGAPWQPSDHARELACVDPKMMWKGVVIDFCGDWAEICLRYGFPTWSHNASPCPKCSCRLAELTGTSLDDDFDFDDRCHTEDWYEDECSKREVFSRDNLHGPRDGPSSSSGCVELGRAADHAATALEGGFETFVPTGMSRVILGRVRRLCPRL